MKRKTKIITGGCLGLLLLAGVAAIFTFPRIYRAMDAAYQKSTDQVRIKHAQRIAGIVLEYADKTGKLPFEDQAGSKPFMVLIGRSQNEEDAFANEEVLKKGATFANSAILEAELSKGLGREIVLPRDPQKVATFAPNVYVYFIADGQVTIIAHLFEPSAQSVEYQWRGGTFHSHTLTYSRKEEGSAKQPAE